MKLSSTAPDGFLVHSHAGDDWPTCRDYVRRRGTSAGARRDLEDLRAAIEHHAKEGLHRGLVRVTLPPKGPARDRWL